MPLFSRRDGTPLANVNLVRRMMPFLMPGRNESIIFFEHLLDLTKTLPFIARYNAEHTQKITIFHVVLYAIGRGMRARPGLDRFVSGGRLYQRASTSLSFAAKRELKDESPFLTVKLDIPKDESFDDFVARVAQAVDGRRAGVKQAVDTELKWLLKLPPFLVSLVMWCVRKLDAWNLLPYALIKNDPMYATVFAANLGSVGIDRVYHHLYEYGTVSLFCVIGAVRKDVWAGPNNTPEVRDTLSVRWSFDERINDGHYCAASLAIVKGLIEDPERMGEWSTLSSLPAAS